MAMGERRVAHCLDGYVVAKSAENGATTYHSWWGKLIDIGAGVGATNERMRWTAQSWTAPSSSPGLGGAVFALALLVPGGLLARWVALLCVV